MLEQPPEKSEMEIAAEIAAAAQQQMSAPNRAQGFLRVIIWIAPLFVVGFISFYTLFALIEMVKMKSVGTIGVITVVIALASIYVIGCLDGILSRKTFSADKLLRKRKIYLHAFQFTLWQIIIFFSVVFLAWGTCLVIMR